MSNKTGSSLSLTFLRNITVCANDCLHRASTLIFGWLTDFSDLLITRSAHILSRASIVTMLFPLTTCQPSQDPFPWGYNFSVQKISATLNVRLCCSSLIVTKQGLSCQIRPAPCKWTMVFTCGNDESDCCKEDQAFLGTFLSRILNSARTIT